MEILSERYRLNGRGYQSDEMNAAVAAAIYAEACKQGWRNVTVERWDGTQWVPVKVDIVT